MFAKIFPQHFPIRLGLLRHPAFFEILPTLFRLLTAVDHRVVEELPVGKYVKLLHFKNADAGVVCSELVVASFR